MKHPEFLDMKGHLSFLILHEINKKKLCGEDLAILIGNRKKGKLTPGTIYPALKKLKKAKLIKMERRGRKKLYFLTEKGDKELKITYKTFSRLFYGLRSKIKGVK